MIGSIPAPTSDRREPLEQAQLDKKQHIAAKMLLQPGQKVLDIGSGWGGMGLFLGRQYGADVTGVTLSTEQHTVSSRRALEGGLADRVRFKLLDYRQEPGRYDRIVSVGMFEHVGSAHYVEFFTKAKELLDDDGVMLLHSIGRMEPPGGTNTWLRKYIFPGGYSPALSEVLTAIEKAGLWVTDMEILRLHYADTLRHWRQRFLANRERIKQVAGYDERFCRMWEFYLRGCEVAFRYMNPDGLPSAARQEAGRRAADARLHAGCGKGNTVTRVDGGGNSGIHRLTEDLPQLSGIPSPSIGKIR